MKKILCIALATIMLFSMTACGNKEDVKPSQEPTQSTNQPSTDTNTDTETESKYKYESENMKVVNFALDGKIKEYISGNMKTFYFLTTDNTLFYSKTHSNDNVNMPTKIESRFGTFDNIYSLNSQFKGDFLALREEYKLYVNGGDTNYYYNNKYKPLFFNIESGAQSDGALEVLSLDESTNNLIYQRCKKDGSIEEYTVEYVKTEIGKKPETQNLKIKQTFYRSLDSMLLLCEDGTVYAAGKLDTSLFENNKAKYSITPLTMNDPLGYSYEVEHEDRLTNVSRIFTDGGIGLKYIVYGDKSKDTSIFMMIDWDKNESMEIPLPEGKTINDISSLYNTTNSNNGAFDDLIIVFNDGSVYYSFKSDMSALKHSETLSAANKSGALNDIRIIGGECFVLMDDNNLYKITLQ